MRKVEKTGVTLLFTGLISMGANLKGKPKRTELGPLDKASLTEHIPALLYPGFPCVLLGGQSVKTQIWSGSKFKQNLISNNQSQTYVDLLTPYDEAFKYKHIREILKSLVFSTCAAFSGVV